MTHPLVAPAAPVALIGHRGAPGHRPEHTASAYRLAFAAGVDAVEPDVVASRDGVLLVRHENEISGTTDVASRPEFAGRRTRKTVDGVEFEGWFAEDFDWAELAMLRARERLPELRPANTAFDGAEPILRLRDVLALIDAASEREGRPIDAVIELKHAQYFSDLGHDLVALLLAELATCGWLDRPERLVVECFELTPLERLRAAGLPGRLVFLMEREGSPADEVAHLGAEARPFAWYRTDAGLDALRGRVDGISADKADILADADPETGLVARAHARGLTVFTWTLRPENAFLDPRFRTGDNPAGWGDWSGEWRAILASDLDGVFVDHPELARRIG